MKSGDSRRPNQGTAEGLAWWAYCVMSPDAAAAVVLGLEGIERGPVEFVSEGGLAALVSPVPLAEYDDRRLREHLEDLAWVERTARAHEAVLDEALRRAAIVPMRLCTLYFDHDGARRLLRERAASLTAGLAAVDGCTEWGLKLFADPKRVAGGASAVEAPAAAATTGAAYLQRKQRERADAGNAAAVRARCAQAVHDRLSAHARAATVNPPQRPEVHGRGEAMLLNAAYLVENDRDWELGEAVGELHGTWAPQGFALELTGPWPAYNFVSIDAGVAA